MSSKSFSGSLGAAGSAFFKILETKFATPVLELLEEGTSIPSPCALAALAALLLLRDF